MKINFKNKIILIFVFTAQFSFAQKTDSKKDVNIGTEVVNVVKPYAATIADATKVAENAIVDNLENEARIPVKYAIFSFPVASTFAPTKGKSLAVEKEKEADYYSNYATFGVGNYGKINAELFVNQVLDNNKYVCGMLRHLSSQGGIKAVELDDFFYDTAVDLTCGNRENNLAWNVDLGYQHQTYNWYGLPANFGSILPLQDKTNLINSINPRHSFNNIYFGGKIAFQESILTETVAKFNHFSDNYGSIENRFFIKPSFEFIISDKLVKTNAIIDHVGGCFKEDNLNLNAIKYGFTNFGIAPSFAVNENNWDISIGAALFYSLAVKNSDSRFYVYPKISASYKVVGDLMILYVGADGDLKQNTYTDFVAENSFLSPNLNIKPTNTQYDYFVGLKGKFTTTITYNIKASYLNQKDFALFKSNRFNEHTVNENYAFGNSFQVVYDNLKIISFYGDLKADISQNLSVELNGTFNNYQSEFQIKAYNLPMINLKAKIDYNINEKWFAGTHIFYVGQRYDQQFYDSPLIDLNPNFTNSIKGYLDLNTHLGYKHNDQLSAFLRANNITNNSYQKWLNYPVQGFQLVLGANYKFDF